MLLIDDFLIWMTKLMRDYALKEKYDIRAINNQIKENRLLFEIGEIKEKEYKEKNDMLMQQLEEAKAVMKSMPKNMRIQELDGKYS